MDNLPDIMKMGQATMDKVAVEGEPGAYTVNGANILGSVQASNGIVHVIDGVLLPPE